MNNIIDTDNHFENKVIIVKYIEEKDYIWEYWKDFAEDDEILEAKNKQTKIIAHTKCKSFLADIANFKGASPEIQLWVRDTWFIEAYEAGLRNLAFVVPEDVFGVFSVDTVINNSLLGKIKIHKSITKTDAEEWLAENS